MISAYAYAPFVFFQALMDAAFRASIWITLILLAYVAVLLCVLCLVCVITAVPGSGSDCKKGALGAFKRQDSTREFFPRAAVLGWVASVPFMLLIITGSLMEVMMSSPVEGSISKGKGIGSLIEDVGVVGASAISCFVVVPALALRNWRDGQSEWKAGLTV